MKDFTGFTVAPPTPRQFRSRQWVSFRLADKDKQAQLVASGAYATAGGKLVAIYSPAHVVIPIEIVRADGSKEQSGGEAVPDRLVLVDQRGNNFALGVRDEESGHVQVSDIFFFPESPSVKELAAIDKVADLPPGRVFGSRWLEGMHGSHPLPAELHDQHNGEMKPTMFLRLHQSVLPPAPVATTV
jgi:hypothetical protein